MSGTTGIAEHTHRHSVYIQMIQGWNNDHNFFASCMKCGSDPFPDRRLLIEAELDAAQHGQVHHIYPRATLVAHEEACLAAARPSS